MTTLFKLLSVNVIRTFLTLAGAFTLMVVAEIKGLIAFTEPNATVVTLPRLVPVIVTNVPRTPVGVKLVMVGKFTVKESKYSPSVTVNVDVPIKALGVKVN